MTEFNYESKWWGYIYDQMMLEDLPEVLEDHRRFYYSNLKDVHGPVLECACGTGLFFLPLLSSGCDIYGFDISKSMLATLNSKAAAGWFQDLSGRISVQDFESFHYDQRFEAIIIPSNAFAHLTTQAAQIKTLRNIFDHLAPSGRLLMDLRLVGMRGLVEDPPVVEGSWHIWTHPQTGRPIRQRVNGRYDFERRLTLDLCTIEYDGQTEEFPMTGRWIIKDEFQLLLRVTGFQRWECFGTPDRGPLHTGLEDAHSYWIAYKT